MNALAMAGRVASTEMMRTLRQRSPEIRPLPFNLKPDCRRLSDRILPCRLIQGDHRLIVWLSLSC
jgi:hypothetical protein